MNAIPDKAAAPAPKPKAKPKPAPKRRGPSPLAVITSGLGLFFVVLTLLAIQVRSGHDPSLGPGLATPAAIVKSGAKGTATSTATTEAGAIVSRTSPAPPP